MDINVTLNYSSTLEGSISVLVLTCEGDIYQLYLLLNRLSL